MFKKLSRRTFLRGTGVALALPWLDAMAPSTSAAAAVAIPKRRMLCIRYPLSLHPDYFFPEDAGRDYKLSRYLEVLKEFRNDFTVFSGLSHPGQQVGGGHTAEPVFLTGAPLSPNEPNFKNSVSVDQLMAEKVALETRFPSICLARNLSHTRSGATIPNSGRSPSDLFAKMFLDGTPEEIALQKHRLVQGRSIMDVLQGQAKDLQKTIGHSDKGKLDEYFDSVRDVEKGLAVSQEWAKKPKPKVNVPPPKDVEGNGSITTVLYYNLAHLAFVTDSTRVIAMETIHWSVPQLQGVSYDHHNLSHNGKDPEKIRQLAIVDNDAMTALRDFLRKLRDTKEEGQSLLDRTMVLAGSQMHSGAHVTTNLPVLLAGGGFKHGQHLAFDPNNNVPLGNLYVMMLRNFGVDVNSFGTSTGTVPGLEIA